MDAKNRNLVLGLWLVATFAFACWFVFDVMSAKDDTRTTAIANLVGGLIAAGGAYLVFWLGLRHEERRAERELAILSSAAFEPVVTRAIRPIVVELARLLAELRLNQPRYFWAGMQRTESKSIKIADDFRGEVSRRLPDQWSAFGLVQTTFEVLQSVLRRVGGAGIAQMFYSGSLTDEDMVLLTNTLDAIENFARSLAAFLRRLHWLDDAAELAVRAEAIAENALAYSTAIRDEFDRRD